MQEHGFPKIQVERPSVPPPLQLPQHVSLKPQLIRAPRTKAMDTVYSEHAREGFVYWLTDKVKGSCGKCAEKPLTLFRDCTQNSYVDDAVCSGITSR